MGVFVLVVGVIALLVLAAVLWRAWPSWKRGDQWSGQHPIGNSPPEPEGFEKPRNEGDLL
jgi:hypothetical protein